ncbi:glycosyltransferase, partial [Buttiauxella ferragutiae]|uniref:glycosyltransferase n=1 Tax=Buttiauxella ferragutiae TaxID=82989 RepID=UPI0007E42AAF
MHGRVAVIMSVYNKDSLAFLKTAIGSILEQTYKEFDIFIYFDGVKRCDLWEFINVINSKHDNIFFYYESENKGLAYALNYLLEKVKLVGGYQYIARMDADDISDCNRLLEQILYFEEHSDIFILGSNCIEINQVGENIFYKKMPEFNNEINSFIFKRSPLVHPAVMFRYEMVEHICYNPLLKQSQDYFLWVDLLAKGYKIGNVQKYKI